MKTLAFASALALAAGIASAQDVVRMGTEGGYPPYSFINDAGEPDGFEIELGNALCERAGLTCQWVTNEWDSIIPNLVSGNYDTIMAGMNITPERDEVIDFTQDYIPATPSSYVGLSADVDPAGAVVAAQATTIQASHVAGTGATLLEYATQEEAVAAMRNGEADAVFADTDFLAPIVESSGGELTFIGEPVPLGGGMAMGLRESDAELRARFDEAISAMKADGSLNELLAKWFAEDAPGY
ncbi:transporter substrate-binding domain-containing protein [Rubellimicrobium aerolatum]|uniref:Transporter substrate-binding domain-containing protein n=1 Tax=Rubellimicrobium aerolatum TaxID=490979 RepID=A0ABW0SGC4_9RHOB|nr:transporter substrate-binding domain-containing protein [Rubellimicrobium aerolatum]MBP1807374.1 polar amino acid transport system substrate-binding protein [Rubellimicrobium aerolatum]